jgi:hypothetical protein
VRNDRMWIQHAGHPGRWIERSQAEKNNWADEFETTCKRLYARGHFVVLVPSDCCCLQEVFLFEAGSDAETFYDSGFQAFESFVDDADQGNGFHEVSCYEFGHVVASKSVAPTKRIEVKNE